eukprot:43733-Chlamydomonas_euryale.AAC.1
MLCSEQHRHHRTRAGSPRTCAQHRPATGSGGGGAGGVSDSQKLCPDCHSACWKPLHPSIHPSIYPSIHPSIHSPIHPSIAYYRTSHGPVHDKEHLQHMG